MRRAAAAGSRSPVPAVHGTRSTEPSVLQPKTGCDGPVDLLRLSSRGQCRRLSTSFKRSICTQPGDARISGMEIDGWASASDQGLGR